MQNMRKEWKDGRHARQGDIMLIKEPEMPSDAVKQSNKDRVVLAWGEATGHAHAVSTKYATAYEWRGDVLIRTNPGAELVHEEHSTIQLAPGAYRLRRQVEYTPERLRQVAD